MNAPALELAARLAVALMATGTCFVLLYADRRGRGRPSPLIRFLGTVVLATAVWRWGLLWLGFQSEVAHPDVLDWVQPVNALLLFLLLFAVSLIAVFHLRHPPRG